jgi:hypothetical protein
LKALKREEILSKLKKADFLAGKSGFMKDKKLLDKAEKELQTEFIPDLYDKNMDAMFDEKYYEASDDEKNIEDNDLNLQLMNDQVANIGKDQEEEHVSDED